MPMFPCSQVFTVFNVCVCGLSPVLKRRHVIRALNAPDLVTTQCVPPRCRICRVMSNVKTQRREHLFLVGNRE